MIVPRGNGKPLSAGKWLAGRLFVDSWPGCSVDPRPQGLRWAS